MIAAAISHQHHSHHHTATNQPTTAFVFDTGQSILTPKLHRASVVSLKIPTGTALFRVSKVARPVEVGTGCTYYVFSTGILYQILIF